MTIAKTCSLIFVRSDPFRTLLLVQVFILIFSCPDIYGAIRIERLPESGWQPVVRLDTEGQIHRAWLFGDPAKADVRYDRLTSDGRSRTAVQQANFYHGDAIAVGTVRGVRLAVTSAGSPLLLWNGSTVQSNSTHRGAPLWFTHWDVLTQTFERELDLMEKSNDLDGGAAMDADHSNRVFVVWHATDSALDAKGEAARRLWMRISKDGGTSFGSEQRVTGVDPGMCACCGLAVACDREDRVHLLFRSASEGGEQRGMCWAWSEDHGVNWKVQSLQPWTISQCPMSTCALIQERTGMAAYWETQGAIYRAIWTGGDSNPTAPQVVSESRGCKHPAIAWNEAGIGVVAWAKGTGWNRGGSVGWRRLPVDGSSLSTIDNVPGLPVWGNPAVFWMRNSDFIILY